MDHYNSDPSEQQEVKVVEQTSKEKCIVLFNDDVNSFEYVIDTLVEICNHERNQAEQCAMITHFNGKCDVKNGTYKALEPICSELLRRGLTAEIN